MKIALIDPSLFTLPYDAALADGLRANGHDVTLYTKHLAAGELGKGQAGLKELFYKGFEKEWVKSLPHSIFLGLKGVSHFFSHLKLLRVLRKEKPDVIHFQWTPLPVVDRLFVSSYRKIAPVVLTVHDSSPFNNNPSGRLQRIGVFAIMNDFDRLIVHTERAEKALIKHDVKAANLARIQHGVLGSGPNIAHTAAQLKETGPINVLLFGKLKPYKGADVIIRALAEMPVEARQRTRLRIVGKAEMDTAPLFALAKELNMEEHIVWDLRFVDDAEMAAIFADADIMAMPYRDIDASGVMMVALSVGRPIVASKIGLFAELLEDGTHGYLVPQENPAALAKALTDLVNNPQGRLSMGANVHQLGTSIPSWNDIGATTTTLYQQAISAR